MSGNPGGGFGISTIIQTLQNIQTALANIARNLSALVIGPGANNDFTGNNTFSGTNTFTGQVSFKPPPIISAGAVGTGTLLPAGMVSVQANGSGVGNGADTTDDTLFTYTLPARSFDAPDRSLVVKAFGAFAGNGNNKTVKVWFGSSTVFTTGVVATSGGGWLVEADIICTTLPNGQVSASVGFAGTSVITPSIVLPGQTETSNIVIKVTGASPTSGVANDVLGYGMTVLFTN